MPTDAIVSSDALSGAPLRETPAVARYRYRMRFAKADDLRLVSHHDLMHVLERMMRRGEIPFAVTQGFHPQPKMSFALSLALGVVGRNEVFDVELTHDLHPDDLRSRLNAQAPAGLSFHSVVRCEKKPSSQVRRTFYRITVDEPIADLDDRIAAFLSATEHWVIRTRPQRRRINVRPYVCELSREGSTLSMILWVTPTGAARPEEIVQALGLVASLETGAILERTHLELLDEVPEHERFVPDLAAAATSAPAPETTIDIPGGGPDPAIGEPARKHLPTAILDNPLSFDS